MNTVKNGKGSEPRITDYRAFRQGCDEIDWQRQPGSSSPRKFKKVYGSRRPSAPECLPTNFSVDTTNPFSQIYVK